MSEYKSNLQLNFFKDSYINERNSQERIITSPEDYTRFYEIKEKNGVKIIDLFCGCGGFSLGFSRAGYDILAGIDSDKDSLETFKSNLQTRGLEIDLSSDGWINLLQSEINNSPVDVLIGGPPCQGFSLTGTRVFDDPRNILYKAFFDGIDHLNPKFILLENVKGMATLYQGQALKTIIKELEKREFRVSFEVLNSSLFGVPQVRERLFIIAKKGKDKPYLPKSLMSKDNFISCSMAISDLPSLEHSKGEELSDYSKEHNNYYQYIMREGSARLYNHVATIHKDFVVETIRQVPDGGNYKNLPEGVGTSRKFNEAWTRYRSDKPSRTIDTGHRNHFHYKYNRVPTVRENARLQSFPDNFRFSGTKTSQNRQVGNAVPVFLAQALAEAMLNQL